MEPLTFIFIGRSGCGKGTQAKLLQDYLVEKDETGRNIFYCETGQKFRSFISQENYSSMLSKKIYDEGGLQPEFLAISIWADEFISSLKGNEHIIIDGTPRKLREALVLDSALKFYGREKTFVVCLDLPREVSMARMLARGRIDDQKKEEIKKRLDWFDTDVVPAIDYFKNSKDYHFLNIDGNRSVEEVHKDIIRHVFKRGSVGEIVEVK